MNATWMNADVRPDSDRDVLICISGRVCMGYWDDADDDWRHESGNRCFPTHWAELPKPPEATP